MKTQTLPWLNLAKKELGVKEIKGPKHNSRIIEYHSYTHLKATKDEVPWCSSFVNFIMAKCELPRTNSALARSWLNCRGFIKLKKFKHGCIVVLKRGAPPAGHVGFGIQIAGDFISVLGGNQSDEVNITNYPISDVLGYFWPEKYGNLI